MYLLMFTVMTDNDYRIFSNLVRPLISANGHFFEIWTIFCPLISNAAKVLGIFDFPLI